MKKPLKNESTILKTVPEIKAPATDAPGKLIDKKEQRKLNIRTIKENRKAAKKAAKEAKKNGKTIINSNKIENDEN